MNAGSEIVSVIIPVYNEERFLSGAINSVLKQTYESVEIIVIDDGSTDSSVDIAGQYDQVILLQQDHKGVAAARNYGMSIAKGDYISFLDADDEWDAKKIDTQIGYLKKNRSREAVICRFRNFFEKNITPPAWVNRQRFTTDIYQDMPSLVTMLIRKDAFRKVGSFSEHLETGSDIDWFARAKDAGITMELIPETLVYRRLHDRNLSYKARSNQSDLLKIFKASLDRKRSGKNEES